MAEIVISSLLEFVIDKLASKALSEFRLQTGIDKELKKLARTLSTIRDVLEDAEARQVKSKTLSSWLRDLKDLAYDADDVLDEIAFKAEKSKKVPWLPLSPKNVDLRGNIADRVKEINDRSDEIAKNRSNFYLKEGVGQSLKIESIPINEETGSFIRESEVHGRQGDKEKIVEFLMNASTEGDNIDVIGIVGLGGLGKTTLARLVYNEKGVVDGHFEKKMWVCVSEEFEIKKLIRLMIESATGKKFSSPISMDALQESLINEIKGKRFLLVLDDVWNDRREKWDSLMSLLTVGARGSKVIVTTRNVDIASMMGAISPHQLSILSLDDCWLLFKSRAFCIGVEKNPNLVMIGKEIVKKCGGVPLAAKALGSLLRFKTTENEWLAIKKSDLWDKNDEVLPALKLSYNHLSSALKQCFAYCSIFPKDYEINTNRLVKLWGAEGFLNPSESERHMHWEDIGLGYVRDLLARSLFLESMEFGPKWVKMHDLVHDLARSVAADECSILDTATGRNLSQNSRYASFICNEKPLSVALQSLRNAKNLRTFYLDDKTEATAETEQSVQEVLDVISCNINRLRALHLTRYPLKDLPNSFKKLKHLRYLDLSSTPLEFFPLCISTLHNLQTLSFRGSNIKSIPDSIGNLHNLCTLNLYHCHLSSVPDSIGNLHNLCTLDLSHCSDLSSVPDSMGNLHNLCTLDLSHCSDLSSVPDSIGNLHNLCTLDLSHCSLSSVPDSIGNLHNLCTLDLSRCYDLSSVPDSIGNLHNLCTLKLTNCSLSSIPDSIGNLHNLCTLDLRYCSNLSSVPSSISLLKCLRELYLSGTQIESLPESICTLSNLHTLGLEYCRGIHELPQNLSNMKSLVHLNIQNCIGLTCMPVNLGKLNQLRTLPVFFVSGGKTNCSSLTELGSLKLEGELKLKNLENMRNVEEAKGAQLSDKHAIQSLNLSWGESSYYEDELIDVKIQLAEDVLQNLQPTKSLRDLEIKYYVGRTFPPWMMELSLSNLVRLELSHCNCEKTPPLGQLPQLEVLVLDLLPLIKHLGSDFYGGANAFPSLRKLYLFKMISLEEWCDAGGEQLHPCLRLLTLRGCPKLKALPSNFSSVEVLVMDVAHDKLLLSSLQNRGFPNVKSITMWNDNNDIDPLLTERADSLRTLAENLNLDIFESRTGVIKFLRRT